MSGFEVSGGNIVITQGSREVLNTNGSLVHLVGNEIQTTITVTFPDFTKDNWYSWFWESDWNSLAQTYGQYNGCVSAISIPPQQFSQTTNIMSVPAGINMYAAMVRMNRTTSPTHNWDTSPINPLPIMNQWIPFTGSILMEAELGMARAFSLYISGGNLVLHRQQSVSIAPGGYGTYGDTGPSFQQDRSGGVNTAGSVQGIPVVLIDNRSQSRTVGTPTSFTTCNRGQANACSLSLSTNFSSVYTVELRGFLGRAS